MRTFSVTILFLILAALSVSCSQEKCPSGSTKEECQVSELERVGFFNIAYETIASRPISSSASTWIEVNGCREMKFASNISAEDDAALPANLTGDFIIALQSFKTSASTGPCAGGNKGAYTMTFQDGESAETVADEDKPPFSIFDPFNDVTRVNYVEDEEENDDPDNEIRTYLFAMTPAQETTGPQSEMCGGQIYCAAREANNSIDQDKHPCDYSFKVVRFPNGHLILDDTSKGVQYYLKPRLSDDTASKCLKSNIPK